jgi:hypothetical protein
VVPNAKTLCHGSDGWSRTLREATEREEKLMLLRLDSGLTCSALAERQELAYLVPES